MMEQRLFLFRCVFVITVILFNEGTVAFSNTLLVAAIDFGTTYSGYAYSTRDEYRRDPLTIYGYREWSTTGSYKTPTSILLRKNMTVEAFGKEAESRYVDLCERSDTRRKEFPFFRHFKLLLHSTSGLNRETELESVQGMKYSALIVFSASIRYLKDHLLENVRNSIIGLELDDIQWVLTVPAIWHDAAKQFMREAAEMAGIDKDRLLLALEPEAASIYCMKLKVKKDKEAAMLRTFEPGTSYMVLDIGGGTADISVHEIASDGKVYEVTKSSGGVAGGMKVDAEFHKFMSSIYGQKIMDIFHTEYPDGSFELNKTLESQKSSIKPPHEWLSFVLPDSLRHLYKEQTQNENPHGKHSFGHDVEFVINKIRLRHSLLDDIFQPTITSIMDYLRELRNKEVVKKVQYVFVVGGMALCPVLMQGLKKAFENELTFIVPEDAVMAVLKGAVLFGHDPEGAIAGRRSPATYGFETIDVFVSGQHPIQKKQIFDGEERCLDVFLKIIEDNHLLLYGAKIERTFRPIWSEQTLMKLSLYKTQTKDPQFTTDEGVQHVGSFLVEMPDTTGGRWRQVHATVIVGGTELKVSAVDANSGKLFSARFDFL